jgi:nucleoid DNA-binding protein
MIRKGEKIMTITREEMIKKLSVKSGYYQQDVRHLMQCLDEVVLECLGEATLDQEVQVQLIKGVKCGCKILGERERVKPDTQEPIIVGETAKPFVKFSNDFKSKLQEQYESKKDD